MLFLLQSDEYLARLQIFAVWTKNQFLLSGQAFLELLRRCISLSAIPGV